MTRRKTVGAAAAVLVLLAVANASEAQTCSDALFSATTHLFGVITPSDRTLLRNVSYGGRGERTAYDGRVERAVTFNAYLFNVQYGANREIEFQVNPEAGSIESARAAVDDFASLIGQMPTVLLSELVVVIHVGDFGIFYGGSGGIVVYSPIEEPEVIPNIEEILMHEATHAVLESEHRYAPDWVAAKESDGGFVSQYACENPTREDLAESFVGWFAVRYQPGALTHVQYRWILETIPNRLAYLDQQGFDMSPYLPAMPVPALPWPAVFAGAAGLLSAGLMRLRRRKARAAARP